MPCFEPCVTGILFSSRPVRGVVVGGADVLPAPTAYFVTARWPAPGRTRGPAFLREKVYAKDFGTEKANRGETLRFDHGIRRPF